MNERTKHFYIWITVVTLGVVASLLVLMKIVDFRRGEDISLMESAFSKVKTVFQLKNKLLTYQSKDKAFSFQYPKKLTLTEKVNKIELSHQIPYKNNGDCNMKGDNVVFDYLTDFKASFEIFNGTVKQAVLKYSPYMPVENFKGDTLKINSGFIDEYKIGDLSGFSIYEGVEGCGHVIYYFPIKDNQTLIVEKAMIQALSPVIVKEERDKVLKVPGVITPEESEQIFEKILGSLRFLDKTSSLSKVCPEEWYEDQMPKLLSNINREYFIYNGMRREVSEFDIDWVMKNCNIKKQVVY